MPISLSHEVMPKAPEFERTSTTVVNAYVGPRMTGYLDRLTERLRAAGYAKQLLVVTSSGGVMTRDYLARAPVRILASGPAGGVIGAAALGRRARASRTSCAWTWAAPATTCRWCARGAGARRARLELAAPLRDRAADGERRDARRRRRLALSGAATAALQVGPASAGADPGPICYGRGGARPP